jgi:hypothetical protein
MSHHFDTMQAKEDPRLNCCDFYLFPGRHGCTVMAMTSNADAGISSPDTFHPESLYAVRFDTNGDAREEVVFKFRFGEAQHAARDEHRHVQPFRVIHARQGQVSGVDGDIVAEGSTGETIVVGGIGAFAGLVPELWAADAVAFFTTLTNLFIADKYDPAVFEHRQNLFHNRNVMAIILEVPNELIGKGQVGVLGLNFPFRPRARGPDLSMGLSSDHPPLSVKPLDAGADREIPRQRPLRRRTDHWPSHRGLRGAAGGARQRSERP